MSDPANTNENELLRMLGRWQDLALELGFAAGTGPREITRKLARVIRAADAFCNYEPDPDADRNMIARDHADNLAAMRQALADYHASTRDRRQRVAERLAADFRRDPIVDRIQARIDALKPKES